MNYPKADLFKRFIASLIDGVIASILIYVPVLGGIVSTVYTLTKDVIAYEITKNPDFKNRSLGKKIMGLEVASLEGQDMDWTLSIRRNLPIAIGSVCAIVPIIGWIIGAIIGCIISIIEVVLVLTDNKGRRLGDRWANTQVVCTEDLANKEDIIDI
ncbi:MAG TPA: RDD family protein [Thermoanaerobacterales bacterium]|nr:RDD family protein [Thermoanaerobacterales bacterium]